MAVLGRKGPTEATFTRALHANAWVPARRPETPQQLPAASRPPHSRTPRCRLPSRHRARVDVRFRSLASVPSAFVLTTPSCSSEHACACKAVRDCKTVATVKPCACGRVRLCSRCDCEAASDCEALKPRATGKPLGRPHATVKPRDRDMCTLGWTAVDSTDPNSTRTRIRTLLAPRSTLYSRTFYSRFLTLSICTPESPVIPS